MTAPIDPARAMVHYVGDGSVQFADPDAPWLVRLWVDLDGGRARIGALRVDAKDLAHPVTAGRLAALPLPHLLHVASAHLAAHHAPNEAFYRMLAHPKPPGQAGWDDGHYDRVLQVYAWGRTGYPGGGAEAVADMWGVARNPTANRWLAEARRRQAEQV